MLHSQSEKQPYGRIFVKTKRGLNPQLGSPTPSRQNADFVNTVGTRDDVGDFVNLRFKCEFSLASLGGGHFADFNDFDSHITSHDIEHGGFGIFTVAEDSELKLSFPVSSGGFGRWVDLDDEHALHGIHQTGRLFLAFYKVQPYGNTLLIPNGDCFIFRLFGLLPCPTLHYLWETIKTHSPVVYSSV